MKPLHQLVIFLTIVSLLTISQGCVFQQDIENARMSGAAAGQKDGQRAGAAAESIASFKDAEDRSYTETLSKLYSSGDYYRPPAFEVIAVAASFTLGFLLQYGILYSLRMTGIFTDVDWIVLSAETKQNLSRISDQNSQVSLHQPQLKLPKSTPNDEPGVN
jgi:hypothetical protein